MDDLAALHPHGLFLRGEALDLGYRDRDLVAGLREKALVRVRHGAYVAAGTWAAASAEDRFRLRGRAVSLRHGDRIALSHTSGAAALGLRLWAADFSKVHVTRLDGGPSRCHGDIVYHSPDLDPQDVLALDEQLVMSPVRSALGAATLHSVEQGLVILDSLIDLALSDMDELLALHQQLRGQPHTARLEITVRLVEPGAQSAGESRSRFLCFSQHLPKPVLQYEVRDEDGELVGITDLAWPEHRLLGEFDGKVKYGRFLKPGEAPGDAVFREKVREDLLREITGFAMVRLIWLDLMNPRATAARIRRLLSSRAA